MTARERFITIPFILLRDPKVRPSSEISVTSMRTVCNINLLNHYFDCTALSFIHDIDLDLWARNGSLYKINTQFKRIREDPRRARLLGKFVRKLQRLSVTRAINFRETIGYFLLSLDR